MKEKEDSSVISVLAIDSSDTNVVRTFSIRYCFTAGMCRICWRMVLFPAVIASRTATAPMVVLENTGGKKKWVWSDVMACCKYSPEGVSASMAATPSLPTRRESLFTPEMVWKRRVTSEVGSDGKREEKANVWRGSRSSDGVVWRLVPSSPG